MMILHKQQCARYLESKNDDEISLDPRQKYFPAQKKKE